MIDVTTLYIVGKVYDPLESSSRLTTLNFYAKNLYIRMNAELQADKMFLYSNDTI